jgi:hypothetical protein
MLHRFHNYYQIPTRPKEVPIKWEHFELLYINNAVSAVSYAGLSCSDGVQFVWANIPVFRYC